MNYAKNRKEEILREMRYACKASACIGTIPLAGLIVFGQDFFKLWQPTQDARILQTLSILASGGLLIVSGIQPIGNVFVTVNKVKPQAISVIVSGVLNLMIVIMIIHTTNLGVYAIAGTSTAILVIRNVFYTTPAAARYLGFRWYTFFFGFKYSLIGGGIVLTLGFLFRSLLRPDSWLMLVFACVLTGLLGLVMNMFGILNRDERRKIYGKLKLKNNGK
jgi:O-antigen/teichoic acid export membrane protein